VATEMGGLTSRKAQNLATGRLTEKSIDIADVVVEIASELEKTPAQVALAWTLRNEAVVSPLMGARTLAQLEDNIGALSVDFSQEQLDRLDQVSAVEPCFPHYMIEGDFASGLMGGVHVEKRRR